MSAATHCPYCLGLLENGMRDYSDLYYIKYCPACDKYIDVDDEA